MPGRFLSLMVSEDGVRGCGTGADTSRLFGLVPSELRKAPGVDLLGEGISRAWTKSGPKVLREVVPRPAGRGPIAEDTPWWRALPEDVGVLCCQVLTCAGGARVRRGGKRSAPASLIPCLRENSHASKHKKA